MAEEIDVENGRNSNFEGLVTLTFDPAIRHTVVHQSSTSTCIPNFIQIEETQKPFVDGRTDGCTDGRTDIFPLYIIRSTECLPTRKLDFLLATIICSRHLDHVVRNNYGRTKASKSLISHTKLSLNAARLKRRSMQINVSWSLHHWNLQTMRLSLYSWQYSLLHCQAYKSDIAINGEFLALYVPLRSFNVIKVGTNQ